MKKALTVCVNYNLDVIEDPERDHDTRQKACNCVVQATLAYCRVKELFDLEEDMQRYEGIANKSGDHR